MLYLIKQIKSYWRYNDRVNQYLAPKRLTVDELKNVEKRITEFLEKHGRLVATGIKNLPHIEEGIITAPIQGSCYILRDPKDNEEKYLVFQIKKPYGLFHETGIEYSLIVIGEKDKVDDLIETLKYEGLFSRYWKEGKSSSINIQKQDPKELEKLAELAALPPLNKP